VCNKPSGASSLCSYTPSPPHLGGQVDAGHRVVAVEVKVPDDGQRQARVQLGAAEAQGAHEAHDHQHRAVHGQEGRRHHGVAPAVAHHPDDAGPHQQGKGQPAVVGDAPYLGR